MTNEKFDTFIVLINDLFNSVAKFQPDGHVAIDCPNNYTLTFCMVTKTGYENVIKNCDHINYEKEKFLGNVPKEFHVDFSTQQLENMFNYFSERKHILSMGKYQDRELLFLFTENEILLLGCEETTAINLH